MLLCEGRRCLGFDGLVMTDSIRMKGCVAAAGSRGEAASEPSKQAPIWCFVPREKSNQQSRHQWRAGGFHGNA